LCPKLRHFHCLCRPVLIISMADIDADVDTTALSQKPSAPHPAEKLDATHANGCAGSVGAGLEAVCGAATVDEESGLVHGDVDNSDNSGGSGGGGGSAGASRHKGGKGGKGGRERGQWAQRSHTPI
jgi:hypothetical protein